MKALEEKLVEGLGEVLGRLNLTDEELMFRVDRIEEMRSKMWDCVKSLSIDRYKDEEVESDCEYPGNYFVRPINEQVEILQQYFPHLSFKLYGELKPSELPEGAEGWFVVPKLERIAGADELATEKIMRLINSSLTPSFGMLNFCKKRKTREAIESLSLGSANDFILFPAQFGLRHRGRSVRRAQDLASSSEFFLGLYEVGCMLLTHPERLDASLKTLGIYCAGNEDHCYNGRELFDTPLFRWDIGSNTLIYSDIHYPEKPDKKYGTASGFLYKV
jgi:hypothetical protein